MRAARFFVYASGVCGPYALRGFEQGLNWVAAGFLVGGFVLYVIGALIMDEYTPL